MKKYFRFALMFASAMAISLSFVACGSDDDDVTDVKTKVEQQNEAITEITDEYLDDVVYPTYKNLANETANLYNLISALKVKVKAGTPVTDADIAAICKSYKDARLYWEESEAFLYGAASDFEIDPHIDTWPLDVPTLAADLKDDAKIAKLDAVNGVEWARTEGNLTPENLGFHGIEFIFFRNGENRPTSFFNNNATEDYDGFSGLDVTAKEEVIFAAAIAGDLRDKCYQLEVAWLGTKASAEHIARVTACGFETKTKLGLYYGEDLLAAGKSNSTQRSKKAVMETILVSGCSNICAEVADQKMGQAYRAATSSTTTYHEEEDENGNIIKVEDDPNYIESPYSYNSFTDFYGNIRSIRNSLYGNTGTDKKYDNESVMAYLNKYDASRANELDNRLWKALDALQACIDKGKAGAFVNNPGASYVKTAMDAITSLDDYLNETSEWILKN